MHHLYSLRSLRRLDRQISPHQAVRRMFYHELSLSSSSSRTDRTIPELLHYQSWSDQNSQPDLGESFVKVDVHAAPWNPADANFVQGTYASPYDQRNHSGITGLETALAQSKAVAEDIRQSKYRRDAIVVGSEGIGRVSHVPPHVGADVKLNVGDWVTFGLPGLGTMRSSLWLPSDALLPIRQGPKLLSSDDQQALHMATLFQLGGTALRMLKDFLPPSELQQDGAVILQNAGNSGVGFMLSQLTKILYPKSAMISLVRRGKRSEQDFTNLVNYLTTSGKNQLVIAEEDLADKDFFREVQSKIHNEVSNKLPVIAFNSVGGSSSSHLLRLLGPGGVHVTYGGMSRQPVTVSTPQLIFRDVQVRGYWHSRWCVQQFIRQTNAQQNMIDELVGYVLSGDLVCPPAQVFSLSQYKEAIEYDESQFSAAIRKKIVFDCQAGT